MATVDSMKSLLVEQMKDLYDRIQAETAGRDGETGERRDPVANEQTQWRTTVRDRVSTGTSRPCDRDAGATGAPSHGGERLDGDRCAPCQAPVKCQQRGGECLGARDVEPVTQRDVRPQGPRPPDQRGDGIALDGKPDQPIERLIGRMVRDAGGTHVRVLRTHLASLGAPDVVFEQECEDLAELEPQIRRVAESQEFKTWSQTMSPRLAQSPKREIYLTT